MSSYSAGHPPDGSLLIVTGSNLRAEEMDRPLAYYVRQRILDEQVRNSHRCVYVIGDFRYLYESSYAELPTISIGGPGVNALAHKWLETVPLLVVVEDEFYIQLTDDDADVMRASVWGMDHESTKVAVATFVEKYLDPFLDLCSQKAQHRS